MRFRIGEFNEGEREADRGQRIEGLTEDAEDWKIQKRKRIRWRIRGFDKGRRRYKM